MFYVLKYYSMLCLKNNIYNQFGFKMFNLVRELINSLGRGCFQQKKAKIDFVNLFPAEIIFEIFSYLNADDLVRCQRLNKRCQVLASDKVLWAAPTFTSPNGAFGKKEWEKYFGDIGKVPPLPKEIYKIFKRETHMLVLIPETINGKRLTLVNLGELVKKPKEGHATDYRYIWDAMIKEYGHQATQSHWALMTKDVIEGSRNKSYADQQTLIAKLNKQTGMNYEISNVLDAATCIFIHYISSGKRLFKDQPLTSTRCREAIQGYQAVIGCFSSTGLFVLCNSLDYDHVGVVALQKFF